MADIVVRLVAGDDQEKSFFLFMDAGIDRRRQASPPRRPHSHLRQLRTFGTAPKPDLTFPSIRY